jgi:riboflavin biosynthesis pyrimidine reductase
MRQWWPRERDEDLDAVYADLPPPGLDRWVAVNMVSSVDGAVVVDGVSGALGGDGDLAGFRALRAAVDVVLVGAGTARAERYGPPKVRSAARAARRARGQAPRPAVAVVTRTLDLTGAEGLLDGDAELHLVTGPDAPADRAEALAARGATLVRTTGPGVDLGEALDLLAGRGLARVLCEGGPRLTHDLLVAGLVDDLFVTVAPTLVGGDGPRLVGGQLAAPHGLVLREGRVHEGELLLRYGVEGPRTAPR